MPLPLCTRIEFNDQVRRDELLATGWREVEVLETWVGPRPRGYAELRAELATLADLPELQRIAVSSFKFDRLHMDPNVPKEEADAVKRKWVADAFDDPDRVVSLIRLPRGIGGFLIHRLDRSGHQTKRMIIDLLAVAPEYQRYGIARNLVTQVAESTGARRLKAGTQSTNEPARAFYKSLGMRVMQRQRTFHKP